MSQKQSSRKSVANIYPLKTTLRVGLVWSAATNASSYLPMLQAIVKHPGTTLCVQIKHSRAEHRSFAGSLIHPAHALVDGFRGNSSAAADQHEWHKTLASMPSIAIKDISNPTEIECKQLAACTLDIVLFCGPSGDFSALTSLATHGVWAARIRGAESQYLDFTPRFDYFAKRKVMHVSLLRWQHLAAELLGEVVIPLRPSQSLNQLREHMAQAASELIGWRVQQVYDGGWRRLHSTPVEVTEATPENPQRWEPTVRDILSTLGSKLLRKVSSRLSSQPGNSEWRVGIRPLVSNSPPWSGLWNDVTWLRPRDGTYLADPFLLDEGGQTWLFAEEFVHAHGKGRLVCGKVGEHGLIEHWVTILELPHHLSFPNVFKHRGEIYLIPESAEAGKIELYRAVEFPFRWEIVKVLIDRPGLDTVVHFGADDYAYFFTSLQSGKLSAPQLMLYYARGLTGNWIRHPRTPVVMDVRYGRNAGQMLQQKTTQGRSALVRVSQDGTEQYGARLHFHFIKDLNPLNYVETHVGTLDAWEGQNGTHHYTKSSRWEAIDASTDIKRLQGR